MVTTSVSGDFALAQGILFANPLKNTARYMSTNIPSIDKPQGAGIYRAIPVTKKPKIISKMIPVFGFLKMAYMSAAINKKLNTPIKPMIPVLTITSVTSIEIAIIGISKEGFANLVAPVCTSKGLLYFLNERILIS